MRRMLRLVLAWGVALLLLFAAALGTFFALQPTSFRIARSRTIAAPAGEVRDVLSDMRRFSAVDPHLGPIDPARTITVSPSPIGPGAWVETHDHGGTSRLTLVAVSEARVEFENRNDGAEGGAHLTFDLVPRGASTEVSLSLSNELHGLGRALWPFVGLEARIAAPMDAALRRLETVAAP